MFRLWYDPFMPQPFLVFFPPRLIVPDFNKGDHNDVLDDARDRYINEGIVLVDAQGLKEAQMIIAYAKGFPDLMEPPSSKSD